MANIIGGIIALALGVLGLLINWWRVVELLQGLIPLLLIGGGLVATFAGMSMIEEKPQKVVSRVPEDKKKSALVR